MATKTTTSNVTQLTCATSVINSITFSSAVNTNGYPYYILKNLSDGIMYISHRNDFQIDDDGVHILDIGESTVILGQGNVIYIRALSIGTIMVMASDNPYNPYKTAPRGGVDGADGIVVSVNDIEHVDGNISIDADDIPESSTRKWAIPTNEMNVNTNNLIPSSAYASATTSEVQVDGEDTYILTNSSLSVLTITENLADYYYFKIRCRCDVAVEYTTNIQVASYIDGSWNWAVVSQNLADAGADKTLAFVFPVHPDAAQLTFTITAGTGQNLYFNQAIITEGSYSQNYYESVDSIASRDTSNVLYNKFIATFGDSIMRGGGNNWMGFLEQLDEIANGTCGGYNQSVNGATIGYPAGITNYVKQQIDTYFSTKGRCDIALINGMVNECWFGTEIAVGAVEAAYDATFDTDTFCGALEEIFSYLKTNHPNVKIVYMTSHKVRDALEKLAIWHPASLAVCKKWAVPVIDMYEECQLVPSIQAVNEAYFYYNGGVYDACHFTADGYEYLNPMIENKLKSI